MTERLRLGFLGVGWIGRHRLQALLDSGLAEAVVLADPAPACLDEAARLAPDAVQVAELPALLEHDLDGVVIATPSARHAEQSIQVLEHGLPVFCQKPLGRSGDEVAAVVGAARTADRRLGVDLSYRHVTGMQTARGLIGDGTLGRVFAMELVFHNAYGPDKPWFYERALAGGGCVMDLGIHLVDLALWLLDEGSVKRVTSRCFSGGRPLRENREAVEDYATARIDFESGVVADLACSWKLSIGKDCEIGIRVHGTQGSVGLRNTGGSFYDFVIEHFDGRTAQVIAEPPDLWGGRAAVAWAEAIRANPRFDASSAGELVEVARVLDRIYANEGL